MQINRAAIIDEAQARFCPSFDKLEESRGLILGGGTQRGIRRGLRVPFHMYIVTSVPLRHIAVRRRYSLVTIFPTQFRRDLLRDEARRCPRATDNLRRTTIIFSASV